MQGNRGAQSLRCWATAARAARPASLASSARTKVLEANHLQASSSYALPKTIGARGSMLVGAGAATFRVRSFHSPSTEEALHKGRASCAKKLKLCKARVHSLQTQALRRSAKPNTRGRAGTSCFAARAGDFGLLAGGATQRTMHAGCVPQSALPNPSIERTSPGKPGAASHLKR